MKKLFLIALASISLSVFAGEKVVENKAVENTVITTNELGQVTKIVTVTNGDKVTTLYFIDRGTKVPLKYRAKWVSMSEEERIGVLFSQTPIQDDQVPLVYPKKVEAEPVVFVCTPDEETRVIKLRDEEEGE